MNKRSRFSSSPDQQALPRSFEDLETPCALVDLDRLSANLDRMASYTAIHSLALRPHVKTHKSLRVAGEQIRFGAVGLTCATPRELEVMSEVADDLLLAYPLLGTPKLNRVMALAESARITVALDSMIAVDQLAEAARAVDREIGVYVEVDMGMHRVGLQSADEVLALATYVGTQKPLVFRGVAFYPGHIRESGDAMTTKLDQLNVDLAALLDRLRAGGVNPGVVSGGSTPLAWRIHEVANVTEVRPGTYVYNDRTTAMIGACGWEDCAFSVLATVVSTAVDGQAVIDAGAKALGREPVRGVSGEGFGALLNRPEVTVQRMSEEHGILDLSDTSWRPVVGEQVRVVPNHVCIVVHLNDMIFGIRGDQVESAWPVNARGRAVAL